MSSLKSICHFAQLLVILLLVAALSSNNVASTPHRLDLNKKNPPISKGFCPKGSKGFFVLYYGTDEDDYKKIRALQPDFVITGELDEQQIKDGMVERFYQYTHDKSSSAPPVRAIRYIDTKTKEDHKRIDGSIIDKLAEQALKIGYEGIFFDDIEEVDEDGKPSYDYNYQRAKVVKNHGQDRIVIMNPGQVITGKEMFDYADIVSVENEWFKLLPQWQGIAANRWLSVQGDPATMADDPRYIPPKELSSAMKRLVEFRSGKHNGKQGGKGFWYYTSGEHHWQLPDFKIEDFKAAIAKLTGVDNTCP